MLLRQASKQKKAFYAQQVHKTITEKVKCIISWKYKTKWLHFSGKFKTITTTLYQAWSPAADGVPTHPIHYSLYSSHWLTSLCLFSAPPELPVGMVVVWSWGLKGSVDMTFKAWGSMLPLSQEMNLSHGLCLSHEEQQATWESAGSHGLYRRFLSVPISLSLVLPK